MNKHSRKDVFVIGFALFSMFFGAGNVIFPPYLGMGSGASWVLGYVCYYIADIGLALVSMYAIFRVGGADKLLSPIGKVSSTILMCAIVLCIGPMLAIPRTAAMTFEMSVQPLTDSIGSVVFAVIFFAIVLVCSIRENAVVDIVGKILTPLLLFGLIVLIVKGIITPLGPTTEPAELANVAGEGVKAGYQTMDVLATMLFGALILRSAEDKGYVEHSDKRNVAIKSSLVAGVLLMLIYGGLTYLGATSSTMYDQSTGRSELIVAIVRGLLGQKGTILFATVVALACITTAIGLVSSCADYFSELSNGRISYKALVIGICVFSAVVSNVGLDQIVSIAAPILDIVYPPTLVIIALSFVPGLSYSVFKFATFGALVMSTITAISTYLGVSMPFLAKLPFASLGFGWIVPAAVVGLIGFAFRNSQKNV